MPGSRSRKFGFGLIAIAGSILVALVLCETVLRVLKLAPTDGAFTVNESDFDRIPGIFAPNRRITDRSIPALTHQITIDQLGYRSSFADDGAARSEMRVLFVGDSFTFGEYVNDDETLPAQVKLRLQHGCRSPLRVINAGLRGSTITEHARMMERAFGLAPAVVVLVFSSNDVEDLRRPALWDRLAESRAAKSRFPLRVVYPLLRRTALWNLGLKAAAQRTARANTAPVPGDGQRAAADKQKLRDQYRHALLALRDRLTARGIALLFVVYPSHQHFNRDSSSPEIADTEWAARTALQGEIPLVDLLPPLRATALPVERLYLLPHDAHPSPEGHAIAGQVVARELAEQPLIRKLCRP